ncbi:hypothetical protein ABKV19_008846 [Rosa sericea]
MHLDLLRGFFMSKKLWRRWTAVIMTTFGTATILMEDTSEEFVHLGRTRSPEGAGAEAWNHRMAQDFSNSEHPVFSN